jgi:hypothetical protein
LEPVGLVDGDRFQKIAEAVGLAIKRIKDGAVRAPFVGHLFDDRGGGSRKLSIDTLHIAAIIEAAACADADMEGRKFLGRRNGVVGDVV